MTDAEIIQLLKIKLQETLDENDRLKALVANLTEGANAHQTLQSLYRNVDLPESLRAKCAIGALPHETPRLEPVPPPLDLVAEPPPIPLAELVHRRRKRQVALENVPPGDPRWDEWIERADGTYPADDD